MPTPTLEVKIYLGSASDKLLDIANYLKKELPHLKIIIKPLNQLTHGTRN